MAIFNFAWRARKLLYYGDVIHSPYRKSAVEHEVVFKMRESVPTARYSPVCNVLRQWKTSLILTYRVYRLYDIVLYICVLSYSVTYIHVRIYIVPICILHVYVYIHVHVCNLQFSCLFTYFFVIHTLVIFILHLLLLLLLPPSSSLPDWR